MTKLFDLDQWSEILQTVTRNKSRSLLTAFGVFWGIFMLVFLMGGGEGLKRFMAQNFAGLAQNSCFLMPGTTSKAYKGFQSGREWSLKNADVDRIRRAVPAVETVTPMAACWGRTFSYDDQQSRGTLKGVRADYADIEEPHLTHGRFLTDTDERDSRKVCVIGKRVYEELFPDVDNPCGRYVEVDGVYYQVVGVSKMTSNIGIMGSAEQSVMIPFRTLQRLYHRGDDVQAIGFTARRGTTVTSIQADVERVVRQAHLLAPDDGQALHVFNLETLFQMIDNLFRGIETLVWLIGVGTLLSGAIGVSNIMMVTVRERTGEIGIRRAIGARPSSILWQVMAESIVLTVIAGLAGITFAVALLSGVEHIVAAQGETISFQVSFGLALGAAAALAVLGGLAGLAPSMRALSIRPIDAIRDE